MNNASTPVPQLDPDSLSLEEWMFFAECLLQEPGVPIEMRDALIAKRESLLCGLPCAWYIVSEAIH